MRNQTEALIIPHILREPNSIIVLLFICIYIGLRVNACTVMVAQRYHRFFQQFILFYIIILCFKYKLNFKRFIFLVLECEFNCISTNTIPKYCIRKE